MSNSDKDHENKDKDKNVINNNMKNNDIKNEKEQQIKKEQANNNDVNNNNNNNNSMMELKSENGNNDSNLLYLDEFLNKIGCNRYRGVFVEQQLTDWESIEGLTEQQLISMNIKIIGDQNRILKEIKERRHQNNNNINKSYTYSNQSNSMVFGQLSKFNNSYLEFYEYMKGKYSNINHPKLNPSEFIAKMDKYLFDNNTNEANALAANLKKIFDKHDWTKDLYSRKWNTERPIARMIARLLNQTEPIGAETQPNNVINNQNEVEIKSSSNIALRLRPKNKNNAESDRESSLSISEKYHVYDFSDRKVLKVMQCCNDRPDHFIVSTVYGSVAINPLQTCKVLAVGDAKLAQCMDNSVGILKNKDIGQVWYYMKKMFEESHHNCIIGYLFNQHYIQYYLQVCDYDENQHQYIFHYYETIPELWNQCNFSIFGTILTSLDLNKITPKYPTGNIWDKYIPIRCLNYVPSESDMCLESNVWHVCDQTYNNMYVIKKTSNVNKECNFYESIKSNETLSNLIPNKIKKIGDNTMIMSYLGSSLTIPSLAGSKKKSEIVRGMIYAVADLHSCGYAHNDIRYPNILFFEEENKQKVYLIDFEKVTELNQNNQKTDLKNLCYILYLLSDWFPFDRIPYTDGWVDIETSKKDFQNAEKIAMIIIKEMINDLKLNNNNIDFKSTYFKHLKIIFEYPPKQIETNKKHKFIAINNKNEQLDNDDIDIDMNQNNNKIIGNKRKFGEMEVNANKPKVSNQPPNKKQKY